MLIPGEATAPENAAASVEERVRRLIAETAGWGSEPGPLLDTSLDSLTLIAIVTRIEAAFAIAFGTDEIVVLLGARDSSELARLVAQKLRAQKENLGEAAGNGSC